MSVTFKCDRCGEAFDLRDYTMLSSIQMTVSNIGCPQEYEFNLCPSCTQKLSDWLTPDEQKPDTGNKNKWNSMNVQPQCGEAVEIKFENGDLDLAYRKYADKRWFQSSEKWVASDSKIVAWRYLY